MSFLPNNLHKGTDFKSSSSHVHFFHRFLQMTSGQSNPVFQTSIPRGNPRLGSAQISQPTFLESSVSQAYKTLSSAPAIPQTGAPRPCRTAPEVSLPFSHPALTPECNHTLTLHVLDFYYHFYIRHKISICGNLV